MKSGYILFFTLLISSALNIPGFGETGTIDTESDTHRGSIELVIQDPHSYPATAWAISPVDPMYATGSHDKTIKVWNFSGRVLRTITGHTGGITHISFSPDGNYIVSSGLDNTVRVWTKEGIPVTSFSAHTGATIKAYICLSNKILTIGTGEKKFSFDEYADEVWLWSMTGILEKKVQDHHMIEDIPGTRVSPDGRFLVRRLYDRGTEVMDLATERVILSTEPLHHITFSADGRYLVGIHTKGIKSECVVYTLPGGALSISYTLGVEYIQQISIDSSFTFIALRFDNRIIIQKLKTGSRTAEIVDPSGFDYCAFKPDNDDLVTFSRTTCSLWESNGTRISSYPLFEERPAGSYSIAVSPSGEYIAGAFYQNICLWKTEGSYIISFNAREDNSVYFAELEFTPDGKYLGYPVDTDIYFKDMKGNTQKKIENRILQQTVSPNSFLVTKTQQGKYEFYNSIHTKPEKEISLPTADDLVISADGQFGITNPAVYPGDRISLYSFADRSLIREFSSSRFFMDVSISHTNEYIIGSDFGEKEYLDNNISIWKNDGTLIRKFYGGTMSSVAISPDGMYTAIGTDMNDIRIYKADGDLFRVLKGHTQMVADLTFDPAGRRLISISPDQTIKIWDIQNGTNVTFLTRKNEWVMYTEDGYFDASNNGGNLVGITRGIASYGIDQFAIWNNRPDIIMERMGIENEEKKNHYYAIYTNRLRKMEIEDKDLYDIHVPEADIIETKNYGKNITIKFRVYDRLYEIIRYNLYINNVPLFGPLGRVIEGNDRTIIENIELTTGTNKIEVSCWNEKGAESFRALTYADYYMKEKKDLYFIGFVVSTYRDKNLNLKYAHKDVQDLADMFKKMKTEFDTIHIHTYTNEEVTKSMIQGAKMLLLHARPRDTLVLFISGHGVHDTDENATYYYLTHNTDVNDLQNTAAHFGLIENILQGIPPRQKLFLMDTCESGELEEDTRKNYITMADAKGIKARTPRLQALLERKTKRPYVYEKTRFIYNDLSRRSGAIVFSSSRGGEFSYESDRFENGLFTEAIIEGLAGGKADSNNDGIVMIDELRDFVIGEVPRHADGAQNPTVDRDNIYVKFGFPTGKK